MIPTARLAELADLADVRGWRVVLVGDPQQFSAVGRGGMFGLLVDTYDAIELDQVHRFHQPWEGGATLRLRAGDPDITETYDQHGRLHGGTPDAIERAAPKSWWSHRQAGETVALLAPTNDLVDRLNHHCQALRLQAGELDSMAGASSRAGCGCMWGMRSPPAATTATSSPIGGRWSATGPGGLSAPFTPTTASPPPAATAPCTCRPATSPSTSSWPTPPRPPPPKDAPSTTRCSWSTGAVMCGTST